MSKINFNTENPEIEITRAIGKKSDGKITLNTEGGSIEIDLGFASIGATTDYGGAISVGLLGQEITWGREGGTIHIGIGGFTVDVKAEDCIVTEMKSIFGHIVAQRSYPDPGCELPKPFVPPAPQLPPPQPDGTEKLTTGVAYVFVEGIMDFAWYYQVQGYPSVYLYKEGKDRITVQGPSALSPTNNTLDLSACSATSVHEYTNELISGEPPAQWYADGVFGRQKRVSTSRVTGSVTRPGGVRLYYFESFVTSTFERVPSNFSSPGPTGTRGRIYLGEQANIKTDILAYNAAANPTPTAGGPVRTELLKVTKVLPVNPPAVIAPFLPTGNKPPMKDCCDDVRDMLEDIKEVFAVDRLLKDKFPVANTFMAPGCDPASVTQAKNYYEIFQCVVRMMAHGMIFEPRVSIKDADAAKAGDQEFKAKYLNATGWASAVAEALLEVKDDGNVSTNMDIRNGFAVTQTMVGLSDAIYRLNALLDCLGVELIPKIQTVDTPYNLQIQIGKGFGEGNERQIDLNQDEATEKLLPTMLQVKTNKIKTVDIHPRSRSIKDILESIEANLPPRDNG